MKTEALFDKFVAKCPFAVLTQVAMRGLIREDLDDVFEAERSRQYQKELAFSAMANAVADVTLGFAKNFNQAYEEQKENLGVSRNSFYEKIKATELPISEAVVKKSAERAAEMQDQLGFEQWEVLKGYRVFALDGNHLQESEKRLKPLRDEFDAPLAGTIVGRFDLQRQLFDRAYLLDDAHAQESSALDRVVQDLDAKDVAIADRHYCVIEFLRKVDSAGAFFVIRQHGRFKGHLVGERKKIGRTATGEAYEQEIWTSERNDALKMRRVTLVLDNPTRDGDTELHVLTNLPSSADAMTVSDLYGRRWEEETGYYYLTTTLTCELSTVGHPQAALFLFCMATVAFNIRQVVFAAFYAEHVEEAVTEISHHKISVETSRFTDGLLVAIDEPMWDRLLPRDSRGVASLLRSIAASVKVANYKKSRRGPKKPKAIAKPKRPKTHISTKKVLEAAAAKRP